MELTLEQVNKVSQYAGVSFAEARDTLEQVGGDPLEAVLLLERQGKAAPTPGGAWSTRSGAPAEEPAAEEHSAPLPVRRFQHRRYTRQEVRDAILNFLRNCTKITVDIWRDDDLVVGIPLVVCVLLFIVAYYIMIPLTILGLLMRCRYHFSGWEGSTDGINHTMDQVTATVGSWVEQLKREFKDGHRKGK